MSDYNLKTKMDKWGPFEEKESKWLIFSVGNPNEGHGPALPRFIDDVHAKKAAHDLECYGGQRYVAHIPYTTDRCGPVARDWSPFYIPFEDFYRKLIDYMKYHIKIIRQRGEEVSRVILLNGHGGNEDITKRKYQREILKELELKKFISTSAFVTFKYAIKVLDELKNLAKKIIEEKGERFGYKNSEELTEFYSKVLLSAAHASHTEHSLAAAMGLCDMQKIEIMNKLLEKDFKGALKKWPPIGGLGGYLLAGGKYTEALGTQENDKYNLWNCLKGLKELNTGKLIVAPELGALVHRIALKEKIEIVNKYL